MQVEIKDRVIRAFCKQLEESENQHQEAMSRHFIMMDNMIDMHDVRKQVRFSYSIADFLSLSVAMDASVNLGISWESMYDNFLRSIFHSSASFRFDRQAVAC